MKQQNRKIMSTCKQLDVESLGSWPIYIYPKTSGAVEWELMREAGPVPEDACG